MKSDKYIRISNPCLALFLYGNDQPIVGVNDFNKGEKEFSFIKTPEIEELIELYESEVIEDDRLIMSVHKYEQARKELFGE